MPRYLAASALLLFAGWGIWGGPKPPIFLAALATLWLPGHVLLGLIGERTVVRAYTPMAEGPGRLSFEFMASLALLCVAIFPVFLAQGSLAEVRTTTACLWSLVAILSVLLPLRTPPWMQAHAPERGAWAAFTFALLVCIPAVLHFAGGTVDDWWDLAVVRRWAGGASFDFQESFLGTQLSHPRWGWNVWLAVQSMLVTNANEAWAFQARILAPLTAALMISAQAALAAALFRERTKTAAFTILLVPLWLWGTEALPFFVRPHQDKFVAGLILMPVLLAAVVRDTRSRNWRSWFVVCLAALATVSVHPLLYTIALLGVVAIVLAGSPQDRESLRERIRGASVRLAPVLGLLALYPLWQAWQLSPLFQAQGISLSDLSNPVVRAHYWLGRLLFAPGPWYFVNPTAVFGPVVLVALLALYGGRRRSAEPGDRVVWFLTLLPGALIFLPGVAALVGRLWVPWMIYRIGWLVPVPLLLGRLFARSSLIDERYRRWAFQGLLAVAVLALALPTARDRLARDMSEHPKVRVKAPQGQTLEVYQFLARAREVGGVVAAPGFAGLVPALSGRRVLSFGERGTLVFSPNEDEAYRRMAATARFFASDTRPLERERIARSYGTRFAVFPRKWLAPRNEAAVLEQVAAEGFWQSISHGHQTPWQSRSAVLRALPSAWKIVFENDLAFVLRRDNPFAAEEIEAAVQASDRQGWVSAVGARPSEARGVEDPGPRVGLLGSTLGYPAIQAQFEPVPLTLGVSQKLVWEIPGRLWTDDPAEIVVSVDLGRRCRVEAIEVVPYLPRQRREAFLVTVARKKVAVEARDGVAIRLDLAPRRKRRLSIGLRSLLGAAPSLSMIRVFGDPERCDRVQDVGEFQQLPQGVGDLGSLLDLQARFPRNARPLISLAALRSESSPADAQVLLGRAVHAAPDAVVAWIELGAAQDRAGDFEAAFASYKKALSLDSNNAWARGVVAWAYYRSGWKLPAMWHAYLGWRADHRYADALTILAHTFRDAGAHRAAQYALDHAIKVDPWRSWPVLASADFALRDGRGEEAKALLLGFLRRQLHDDDIRAKLIAVETLLLGGDPG